MRAKKLHLVLVGCLGLALMTGCGKSSNPGEAMKERYAPYVDLGDYKAIQYTPTETEVTSEQVDQKVNQLITQNGKTAGMNAVIEANDNIRIQPSTKGKSAEIELSTLPEYAGMLTFKVNGNEVSCPKFATVNGEFASSMYQIQDGDDVCMRNYYTVGQLRTFMDLTTDFYAYVNHQIADEDEKIYENFEVEFVTRKEETIIPDDEIRWTGLPEAG